MKLPFFSRDSWNMEGVTPPWGDRPSIYEHILENIRPGEPGLDEQGLCFLTMTLHEMAKSFVGRQVHLTECSGITGGIVPSSAASSIAGRLRVHKGESGFEPIFEADVPSRDANVVRCIQVACCNVDGAVQQSTNDVKRCGIWRCPRIFTSQSSGSESIKVL